MSFARKAVHWDRDDVKAAAAVLRAHDWDLTRIDVKRFVARRDIAELHCSMLPTTKLLQRLDWDSSAAESLLIFVNEFRCLIEGADSPEGTDHVGTVTQEESIDPNR